MKIGLDFDGVIVNAPKLLAHIAEDVFGKSIPPEKFDRAYVIENELLADHEYEHVKNIAYGAFSSVVHMTPVEGSVDYVNELMKNHEVKIVTSRSEGEFLDVAKEWLKSNNLSVPIDGVGFGINKSKALKGFDVYMDDSLLKLYEIRNIVPHRYLFSWGYNERYDEKKYAKRVHGWDEFVSEIKKLEKK